jgi:hypothetical protein
MKVAFVETNFELNVVGSFVKLKKTVTDVNLVCRIAIKCFCFNGPFTMLTLAC